MKKYEIQTRFYPDTWENCWTDENGRPITFQTADEARAELRKHLNACRLAVDDGDLRDYLPDDYRIYVTFNRG